MEHALGAELLRLSITDRALDHRVRRVAVLRFGHGFEALRPQLCSGQFADPDAVGGSESDSEPTALKDLGAIEA